MVETDAVTTKVLACFTGVGRESLLLGTGGAIGGINGGRVGAKDRGLGGTARLDIAT